MGVILSRDRKKKSAVETLDKLENDIKEIEENRSYAQVQIIKITKLFKIFYTLLYVVFGIYIIFNFNKRILLLKFSELAVFSLLLYLIKKVILYYYARKINKNQTKLNEMKKEKKRILDEVMDKETYKVAKEILDKYSNENISKPNLQLTQDIKPDENIRKRIVSVSNSGKPQLNPSVNKNFSKMQSPKQITPSPAFNRYLPAAGAPGMRLPAPILPLERSYVDRVMEYLIGDGPSNRYALICSHCHSHNGMALKEEFEYIGFKCCYCYSFNPARKIKPEAPKLENNTRDIQKNNESDSDSGSKSSSENYDTEHKAIENSPEDKDETNAKEKTESQEEHDTLNVYNSERASEN